MAVHRGRHHAAVQIGRSEGVKNDINVTPLIDVVLVLLIIFIVVTPMLSKGEPVKLPETAQPEKKKGDPDDLILSIKADGSLYLTSFKSVPQSKEIIAGKLREIAERGKNPPLYIKADQTLRYGVVKEVMLMCETAGFRGVNLLSQEIKAEK